MSLRERFFDKIEGVFAGATEGSSKIRATLLRNGQLEIAAEAMQSAFEKFQEKIVTEGLVDRELAIDDAGWNAIGIESNWDLTHSTLISIIKRSRLMYLMNPLIKRAVTVQELYVWGSGYEIKAEDKDVQEVMDDFFKDPKNQGVVGDAFDIREREQRIDGNTFLIFFRNPANGRARIRKIPVDQILEVICDPEDSEDVWYFMRAIGIGNRVLYPCIDYNPKVKPPKYKDMPINWDNPVLHIKTGGLSDMRYGIPELYSALNWATAYKKILENFASILAAYARLAMKISGNPKGGVAASKSKLGTTVNAGGDAIDKNPPPNTAGWFTAAGGMDVAPIKTANSTTGPDEARALRSMVAAGSDTPEHFFGDSDIGNFATSTTLDRPTELKMVSRQDMWRKIILKIKGKLTEWSALAPNGKLRLAGFTAKVSRDDFNPKELIIVITVPDGKTLNVSVVFPSILSRDVIDRVRAVVMAATLNGSPAEGVIPDRAQLYKLLMTALDEEDVEELCQKYYPKELLQGFVDPKAKLANDTKIADGRKMLGDAAVAQADAAKIAAANPPKPVKSGPANS